MELRSCAREFLRPGPQHPVILNSTLRSSASRASSVPVPTRFSRKPSP